MNSTITLDGIFAKARKMQKRSMSSYELCKSMIRSLNLSWDKYEYAVRTIAKIICV